MSDAPRFPHEKALAIARALDSAAIPHAFGGAIALAFAAEPRATSDVDVNLFVPVSRAEAVLAVLRSIGVPVDDPALRELLERDEQIRLRWTGTWIDLFFSYSPLHDACNERARTVRVLGQPIRVLSPEDLAIFKVLFDRPKDWLDIEAIALSRGDRLDAAYLERWVDAIAGADDPRSARPRALLRDPASRGPG
jgi:hypothetical protein